MRIRLIFFLLSICCLNACKSPAQITAPVEEIDGKNFYMHTIAKGETLYAVSRLYKCDINDILSANPGTTDTIQQGQILKIPVSKSKAEPAQLITQDGATYLLHEVKRKETLFSIAQLYSTDVNKLMAANAGSESGIWKGQILKIPREAKTDNNLRKHVVQQGETLYSISRIYGVTVDELKKENPGLTENLNTGDRLSIPAIAVVSNKLPDKNDEPVSTGSVKIIGEVFQDKYSVALMLPFFSAFKDSSGMSDKDHKLRDVALNFYRGAMTAVDSLDAMGFNAELYVYDVLDGITMAGNVLAKPEMKEMDLIIGPTYREPINEVSKWSARHGVHVVCPIQQPNSVLLSSPNMSKAWASSISQWETIAAYVHQNHKNDNVILVNTNNIEDKRRVDAFRSHYTALTGDSTMTEVAVASGSLYGVRDKLSATKHNVVIAPTHDRNLINSLLKGLSATENTTLFGTEEWENMELIEAKDRNRLHLHYPRVVAVDYNSERIRNWILAYRKKFKSEPTDYAILGFDVMMYYCTGLKQFGIAFPNHFDEIKCSELMGNGFNLVKTGDESGFENKHVFIMGTDNFEVVIKN